MELNKLTDLLGSIKAFLISRRKELNIEERRPIHPRVLIQERDGCILYTWNDFSPLTKTDNPVTHVGAYDNATQTHKVIWIYNQKIKIVSCSINHERTLLAFTLVTKNDSSQEAHHGKEKYSAFLAELQATGERVFSLNIERPNFLKVQFLYPGKGEVNTTREAHMLLFLHKESIGLYHIPLARMGDKGVIMNDQPRTEQIIKKFVWCQWEAPTQRLHYIHNTRYSSNPEKIYPKYSSIQFYQDARFDNMVDVPLNFPFPYIRSGSRSRYGDLPLNPGIPDVELNIQVLSQANGTVCICYQHLIRTKKPQMFTDDEEDEFDINYCICMLHHAKTLHGCVNGLHKSCTTNKRVQFQWSGDYLMVVLPGIFVHLLNVGIEYDPCQHILLHNNENNRKSAIVGRSVSMSPNDITDDNSMTGAASCQDTIPSDKPRSQDEYTDHDVSQSSEAGLPNVMSMISDECRQVRSLTSCFGFTRESSGIGVVYDQYNGILWRVSLNSESLIQYFHTTSWTNRLAILHYMLTRCKDFFYIKRLFKEICEDVTNTKIRNFMAEYLVASTYISMKRQLERDLLRLLPFTSIEPLKGQLEKSQKEERMATITYSAVDSINITSKTARDREFRHAEDVWDSLHRYLQMKQIEPNSRFKYDSVHKNLEKTSKGKDSVRQNEKIFFFENVKDRYHRQTSSGSSSVESSLGNIPEFLRVNTGERMTKLTEQVENCLKEHLEQQLKKDWRAKAKNVAQEFVVCQMQQSKQLCILLWNMNGPVLELEEDEVIPKLYECGTDVEYEMFLLFERLFMVVEEFAFPYPPGFHTFFTALGFRCLNFSLFMQYVDRGVLQLTGGFVTQLLTDLTDEDEEFEIKYQIISKLPKEYAEECFKQWKHPFTSSYLAKQQASHLLTLGKDISKEELEKKSASRTNPAKVNTRYNNNSSVAERDVMSFAPLTSFIQHLEDTESVIESRRKRGENEIPLIDPLLLQEVSLYHTKHEKLYNLSLVNF